MLVFTVLFVITITVITIGMFYGARWAGARIQSTLVARLQAGETIVNSKQVPAAWLTPYRKRINAMRAAGKSDAEIARVGLAAQRRCLQRVDDLIEFFDKRRVTASPDVQRMLMTTLRSERERWQTASWQDLLDDGQAAAPPESGV